MGRIDLKVVVREDFFHSKQQWACSGKVVAMTPNLAGVLLTKFILIIHTGFSTHLSASVVTLQMKPYFFQSSWLAIHGGMHYLV